MAEQVNELRPPFPWEIRVFEDKDGFHYRVPIAWRGAGWRWTAHLTNALHDAGWSVVRERIDSARRQLSTSGSGGHMANC